VELFVSKNRMKTFAVGSNDLEKGTFDKIKRGIYEMRNNYNDPISRLTKLHLRNAYLSLKDTKIVDGSNSEGNSEKDNQSNTLISKYLLLEEAGNP